MPVSKQASVSFVLTKMYIDALAGTAKLTFQRYVEAELIGEAVIDAGPDLVLPVLLAQGDATKSRKDDIADAIYAVAIAQGWFDGVIS
jgi:hypothetical protein